MWPWVQSQNHNEERERGCTWGENGRTKERKEGGRKELKYQNKTI
jgi:hypothetical protein